jgi:hypothetical protein
MAEDAKKPASTRGEQDQLVDTTDCLEAIGTLKSNKNFFFAVCFLCLLVLQGAFWLVPTEYVERPAANTVSDASPATAMILPLAAPAEKTMKIERKTEKTEKAAQGLTADANAQSPEPNAAAPAKTIPAVPIKIKIQFSQLAWAIKLCNFLLIVCSVIYSLTLLFSLKISLVGRLGGIRHITKAVFISFFMVVLLLPWQILFKGVIAGAIYTPQDCLTRGQISKMPPRFRLWLCFFVLPVYG